MFNLGGFLFGLVIAPRRVWRAFVRGRRCGNFYGAPADVTLRKTVGAARRELGLDRPAGPGNAGDALAFAGWVAVVLAPLLAAVVLAVSAA
jgi:hypothetical protein